MVMLRSHEAFYNTASTTLIIGFSQAHHKNFLRNVRALGPEARGCHIEKQASHRWDLAPDTVSLPLVLWWPKKKVRYNAEIGPTCCAAERGVLIFVPEENRKDFEPVQMSP